MKDAMASVEAFLERKHLALAGYSRDPKKFGHVVYRTLKEKGYTVYPINPHGGQAPDGNTIYSDVASLPTDVDAMLIAAKPPVTAALTGDAIQKGIRHLWIQQMSGSREVKDLLSGKDINVVYDRCILMFADPKGIHKFHHWLMKLFHRLPK